MSGSTHLKKAANGDVNAKSLSNEEVYSLLNSLSLEVSSLKSAGTSDAGKMQSLQMALSSPLPALSPPVRFPLHTHVLCRNHIERPTNPVTFTAMDQTLPNGLQASTECFALPSIPNYRSIIAPPFWKINLLRRTGQSCNSLTPQSPPTMPCALELSWHAQWLRSFSMLSK
ncbi:hypothetical protein O181_052126 [Austropuccinia psidii MF-1]|uniref:Uncharacterized protein n=1 Tax=Austropuccinia psidii MF-1 TaxID=1389203 RepID=A0A9Q3HP00_9BASI|nr:hypothetical protein [Austropuccinia psidii MF-1]